MAKVKKGITTTSQGKRTEPTYIDVPPLDLTQPINIPSVQVLEEWPTPLVAFEFHEQEDKGKIAVDLVIKPRCDCKDYEGQSFSCTIHPSVIECPNCHCVHSEREIGGALPPMTLFACNLCGHFYMRNMVNGDYLFTP